ncbi:MAG TPA: hypothetical protein VGP64_01310 [Polyangia bacterium]
MMRSPAGFLLAAGVAGLALSANACGGSGAGQRNGAGGAGGAGLGIGQGGAGGTSGGFAGAAGGGFAGAAGGGFAGAGGAGGAASGSFLPAVTVIGQASFTTNAAPGAAGAATTDSPVGSAAFDGTRLFTPDTYTNRVLGFASVPTTNGASATMVLGQAAATTGKAGTSAASAYLPQSLHADGTTLAVADAGNNRVMLFPLGALASGAATSVVVGWPGVGAAAKGCAADRLRAPAAAFIVGGKLLVADRRNNRVLIWNKVPTDTGVAADSVLGQSTMTSCVSNDSAQNGVSAPPSAQTLSGPADVWSDGTRVLIADRGNNRVLVWSTFPTKSGVAADVVIGQTNFTLARDTASASVLKQPTAVAFDGTRLYVADSGHNRVLGWTGIPTSNGAAASLVIGQGSFTLAAANDDAQTGTDGTAPTARTLAYPTGVAIAGNALVVSDALNRRLLVYRPQ